MRVIFLMSLIGRFAIAQPMIPIGSSAFGGTGDEYIEAMDRTIDGGYVVAGSTNSFGEDTDAFLASTDTAGVPVWQRSFHFRDWDAATCVEALVDGGFIVGGYSARLAEYNSALLVIRTNADGDSVWSLVKSHEDSNFVVYGCGSRPGGYWAAGEIERDEHAVGALWLLSESGQLTHQLAYADVGYQNNFTAAARTEAGDYILAGTVRDSSLAETDLWILKIAEQGGVYWSRRIAHAGNDFVLSLTWLAEGGAVTAGLSDGEDVSGNHFSVKVDPNGTVLWTRSLGEAGYEEHGHGVAELTDGDLLFVGHAHSHETETSELHLVVTSPEGFDDEALTHDTGLNEVGTDVLATAEGGCIVAGYVFGDTASSDALLVRFTPSSETDQHKAMLPFSAGLLGAYPNPFNATTEIRFRLENAVLVNLRVYDLNGREVKKLLSERMSAGFYEIPFEAKELPSGVYFAGLDVGGARQVIKLALLK